MIIFLVADVCEEHWRAYRLLFSRFVCVYVCIFVLLFVFVLAKVTTARLRMARCVLGTMQEAAKITSTGR